MSARSPTPTTATPESTADLDAVVRALSQTQGVSGWTVHDRRTVSHQRYRVFDRVECDRIAHTRSVHITVYTERTVAGETVQGEAGFTLSGEHIDQASGAIAAAVGRAQLVRNRPFELPGNTPVTVTELADSTLVAEPWQGITELAQQMDAGAEGVPVCASEFFADHHRTTVRNSRGFAGAYADTELFCEFVLLAEDSRQAVECYGSARSRRNDAHAVQRAVAQHRTWVADRLGAELPPTGSFPVLFGAEALDTLFSPFVAHASGRAQYEGWSRASLAAPLIAHAEGDRLNLRLDPTLPWRMASTPFDHMGQVNHPVDLLVNGRLQQRSTGKRYADYLDIPATGTAGTLQVACGETSMADILDGYRESGPVIHALRFATFHPNPITGAFSGELRTGYLVDQKGITPLSGGSISGNVWEAFKQARFSAESTRRDAYEGPRGVGLAGVTVAGHT